MTKTPTRTTRDDQERDETMEALLHPDRAHHSELGHTEDTSTSGDTAQHPRSSPREQGAAPIDITRVED